MENLATIVFERTPAGAVAIKAAGDAVPRQLRTLLLAIYGRSPVSQYVPFLTALAPLSEKFAQLEVMGFTRRRTPTADGGVLAPSPYTPLPPLPLSPAAAAVPQEGRQAQQVTEAELRDFASQPPTAFSPLLATPVTNDFANDLQALARRSGFNDTVDSAARFRAPVAKGAAPSQPALANMLALMQAYLSDVAGMEGLPIALMLEQITSLAQLRRELPSYAELVASFKGDCTAHIKTLTGLLDEAQA